MTETAAPLRIAPLDPEDFEAALPDLVELLHAAVLAGASINFILPFAAAEAEAFWRRKVAAPHAAGSLVVLVARSGGRIVGTVHLDIDTPPNQPHRAEVRKLIVHPDQRRRGIARALMAAIEAEAARRGRSLLKLDTRTDDAAEPLYLSLGYLVAGRIPNFCRDTVTPQLASTTILYKEIEIDP